MSGICLPWRPDMPAPAFRRTCALHFAADPIVRLVQDAVWRRSFSDCPGKNRCSPVFFAAQHGSILSAMRRRPLCRPCVLNSTFSPHSGFPRRSGFGGFSPGLFAKGRQPAPQRPVSEPPCGLIRPPAPAASPLRRAFPFPARLACHPLAATSPLRPAGVRNRTAGPQNLPRSGCVPKWINPYSRILRQSRQDGPPEQGRTAPTGWEPWWGI